MGLLDFIFRQAPGAVAGVKRNQREGQEIRRQQMFEDQDRARRDAMDKQQTQRLLEEYQMRQADAPLIAAERQARIADLTARSQGTGSYAPKSVTPPAPKYALKTARGGRVTAVNEETGLDAAGNPVYEREPSSGGAGAGGPGWQFITGADGKTYRANVRTGQVEPADIDMAPKRGEKATLPEQQSYLFSKRGEAANTQLDTMDKENKNPGLFQRTLGASELLNPLAKTDTQQFQRSATDFVMAVLRKDSGAAISESEWEMAYKTWLPRPGDEPPVLQDKAAARRVALDAIKHTAGSMDFGTEGRADAQSPPAAGGDDADAKAAAWLANRRKRP